MLKRPEEGHRRIYRFLVSKELTIGIFISLGLILAATTFIEEKHSALWNIARILFCLMAVNLTFCTLQRIRYLSGPVLIMHLGAVISVIGSGISSYGFVATVNIYEGTSVDKVYRWDLGKEVSIGVDIMVEKLHESYHPVPVQVGVLKGKEKAGLYILKTGEKFDIDGYSVSVDSLELYEKNLRLRVFSDGDYIGSADTSGLSELPKDFPYEFRLVAFRDPVIKDSRVDIKLVDGPQVVAEGSTAVNSPLSWEGLNFYHTATERDRYGNTFVGLQVTRDPGTPYVYTGFGIFACGGIYYLLRKMRGAS
jgi:hypothetical protein